MSKPKLLRVFDETTQDIAYSRLNNPVTVSLSGTSVVVDPSVVIECNTILTFTAPCDCSQVDTITAGGVNYELLDTMQKKPTSAWVTGSLVTVALDCTNKKAYLQGGSGGGSAARTISITLTTAGWDSNNSQVVEVPSIAAEEDSQLVHILPEDTENYLDAGIVCSHHSADHLKFVAEKKPTTDLAVNIVIDDISYYDPDFGGLVEFHASTHGKNGSDPITPAMIGAPTIEEMNAALGNIPTPDVSGQINSHNTDSNAHRDIFNSKVPNTRKINGKSLESDITLDSDSIGAAPKYTYGTTDLVAGSSPLATGTLYFVYK